MNYNENLGKRPSDDKRLFIRSLLYEIPGLMSEEEMLLLSKMAGKAPQTGWVVELGTYRARATILLCRKVGDNRVVSIDNWSMQHHGPNSESLARANLRTFGLKPRLVTEDAKIVPAFVQEVAFLFVDSCHRGPHLREELAAYSPVLRDGALVALHDYGKERYAGFTDTVDQIFDSVSWERVERAASLVVFRYNGV